MNLHSLLFENCDGHSLAVHRILLGILMCLDLIFERGLAQAHVIWGDATAGRCHFPLFEQITRFQQPEAMLAVYSVMLLALFGVIIGFYYRFCALVYTSGFWYLLLVEKSRWNNHSYLFGILALHGCFSDANCCLSLDSWRLNLSRKVPRWQYFLLRFQLLLVYFYAGVKKIDADWLGGFSMVKLSQHWVWMPFRQLFSDDFIDLFIIHICGFVFDISVGFLYLFESTRILAFALSSFFNLMNSQLFHIGMFPWTMIALMPIFCDYNWPTKLFKKISTRECSESPIKIDSVSERDNKKRSKKHSKKAKTKWSVRQLITATIIIAHITFQLIFPFCHRLFPGLNTWTNGLYGYSWDMMIHNWNRIHTRVRVKSIPSGVSSGGENAKWSYIDSEALTLNQRWTHHSDMLLQYRDCLCNILETRHNRTITDLRVDVWSSLNGRFVQRIFRPVNLLTVKWSLFRPNSWVLPLSSNSEKWREIAEQLPQASGSLSRQIGTLSRNASSYTMFIVDYPNYSFETTVGPESRATLRLLSGRLHLYTDSREYFATEPGSELSLRNNVRVVPYGRTEAYYAIVHWNGLPAKKRRKFSAQNGLSLMQTLHNSLINIDSGWRFLVKLVQKHFVHFTGKCACEMRV